ncbi:MAG: cytochrome b/b6 domain-containing protein [Gemmatimonadota bacterium]|nr:cytochrome b/b6 domain-containing protein [Gemmatimonadota bacterium]
MPSDATANRYGAVARAFHWGTALAVPVMLGAGVLMTSEPLEALADPLYVLHKGLGSVLLAVVVLRVLWRLTHPAPRLPSVVPQLQRRIMGMTHVGLYVLLVVMTVSGYIRTVGDGFPIELLDVLGVPPLLPPMPEAAQLALVVHQITAYLLTALVAVHIGAAVHDALFDRKGVFGRMWPPWRASDATGE